jgi:hypothetical protein
MFPMVIPVFGLSPFKPVSMASIHGTNVRTQNPFLPSSNAHPFLQHFLGQVELFHWRSILLEFPEFDAFLAGIFSPFLIDQRRTIAPSSMQVVLPPKY